ncbi:MAG: alpha/beta hydrolase [Actinomycetota bacterium]
MAEIGTGEVVVDGIRSPLVQAGPGEAGEAAVFLHGNPGSSRDWEDLIARTGEVGRAVAFDMPGFGQSQAPRSFDFSPEGYARFIDAALAQLGVQRAHFVVHDVGGIFTWPLALEHPGLIGSVVAMNTGLLDGRRWHRVARMWRRPLLGELVQLLTTRKRFEDGLTADGAMPLPEAFLERMWRDYDRATRRTVLKLYRTMDPPYPASDSWKGALASLDPPALIVWGERDRFVPPKAIERIKTALPGAQVVVLPGSGHFPFADDPEGTAGAIVPFLRSRLG